MRHSLIQYRGQSFKERGNFASSDADSTPKAFFFELVVNVHGGLQTANAIIGERLSG